MRKIAVISGHALGHVGRVLKAISVVESHIAINVDFVSPDINTYSKDLVGGRFKTHLLASDGENFLQRSQKFSFGVESLLKKGGYDLVVQDANPLFWTSLIDFFGIPRLNITNAFLTQLRPEETFQQKLFEKNADNLNKLRVGKGLGEIGNAYELYEADKVLLADPKPLVSILGKVPSNYVQCGACSWSYEGELPEKLKTMHDVFLLSMGSTGKAGIGKEFFESIRALIGKHTVVYAGSQGSDVSKYYGIDLCFEWLPLNKVLVNSKAVMSQGGAGSTYQALMNGCPVFVLPAHQNHKILGNLLHRLGLGYCFKEGLEAVDILELDFEKMTEKAVLFGDCMREENGAENIAREIELCL